MSLRKDIQINLQTALKDKSDVEVSVLRMLQAAILNKEKEKRAKLAKEKEGLKEEELAKESRLVDEEVLDAVASEVKKRKEAIEGFNKGGRKDLAEKEGAELEILKKYLPEQLPEEEIRKLVQEAVTKVGASSQKDIGKVMAELMPKVKGKAEGSTVSRIVRELLS